MDYTKLIEKVDALRDDGMKVTDACEKVGIKEHNYSYYRAKLKKAGALGGKAKTVSASKKLKYLKINTEAAPAEGGKGFSWSPEEVARFIRALAGGGVNGQ